MYCARALVDGVGGGRGALHAGDRRQPQEGALDLLGGAARGRHDRHAIDQRADRERSALVITVTVAVVMALLIAYNSTAINADRRARENATMFAYGVGVGIGRVTAGAMIEALVTGALGTLVGYGL